MTKTTKTQKTRVVGKMKKIERLGEDMKKMKVAMKMKMELKVKGKRRAYRGDSKEDI